MFEIILCEQQVMFFSLSPNDFTQAVPQFLLEDKEGPAEGVKACKIKKLISVLFRMIFVTSWCILKFITLLPPLLFPQRLIFIHSATSLPACNEAVIKKSINLSFFFFITVNKLICCPTGAAEERRRRSEAREHWLSSFTSWWSICRAEPHRLVFLFSCSEMTRLFILPVRPPCVCPSLWFHHHRHEGL